MKYSTLLAFSALVIFILLAWKTPQNNAWNQKVDTALFIQLANNSSTDFIIQFNAKPDLTPAAQMKTKEEKGKFVFEQLKATATASQQAVRNLLNNKGITFQPFLLVNAIKANGDLTLVQQLAERSDVAKITTNPGVKLEESPEIESVTEAQYRAVEWGISKIGADQVWDLGYRGEGVVVAGEDTGYEWEHPALKFAYRGWDGTNADHNYNWHDAIHEISPLHNDPNPSPSLNPCGLEVNYPCDDNDHGTHTMGIIVGEAGANQIGVAPGAKWMACRNMERGYGSPATYVECFEFFLAPTDLDGNNPKPEMAPHVINNSWSCITEEGCNPSTWSLIEDAINNLKAAGIVVVASAGNIAPIDNACETIVNPPGMFLNSFSIGSTTSDDVISNFSRQGPVAIDGSNRIKPNVSAPGSLVRSSIRGDAYKTTSGTSMAGPHVAGLVALIISANPALAGQVDQIEDIIESTADPLTSTLDCNGTPGSAIPNNTYGYGRINALKAVEKALTLVSSSSVEADNTASVHIAPNPFNQEVSLAFSGLKGMTQLRIFSAAGQEVFNQQLDLDTAQTEIFNFANFPVGVYFYRVENATHGFSGKMFKQ